MEMPLMLAVIIVAARAIVRRLAIPPVPTRRLGMSGVALALLLVSELTLVLRLRGQSIAEYVAGRDPVSGTVYAGMLGVFAVIPLLVGQYRTSRNRP
jgi:hypothetical protein